MSQRLTVLIRLVPAPLVESCAVSCANPNRTMVMMMMLMMVVKCTAAPIFIALFGL